MTEPLKIHEVKGRRDLVAPVVAAEIERLGTLYPSLDFGVAEIPPERKDGDNFCRTYGIDRRNGANCVVMEAVRADRRWFVAALLPVGMKMDIGGFVRRHVGARKLSVAALDRVLTYTQMEYGSITILGLPEDCIRLIDKRICAEEFVFVGSGLAKSKLRIPSAVFETGGSFDVVDGLAQEK